MISTGIPASQTGPISSLSLPKTAGSPPFSRTTVRPSAARRASSRPVASPGSPSPSRPSRGTASRAAAGAAMSSTSAGTSVSYTTTSASRRQSNARTVSSPGSPGPAPTNNTLPWRSWCADGEAERSRGIGKVAVWVGPRLAAGGGDREWGSVGVGIAASGRAFEAFGAGGYTLNPCHDTAVHAPLGHGSIPCPRDCRSCSCRITPGPRDSTFDPNFHGE